MKIRNDIESKNSEIENRRNDIFSRNVETIGLIGKIEGKQKSRKFWIGTKNLYRRFMNWIRGK